MCDVRDVDTFGDHQLHDRVPEHLAGDPYRDRTQPADLTDLVTEHIPAYQRRMIDPDQRHVLRRCRLPATGIASDRAAALGAAGELDQRVERVRRVRLPAAVRT